MHDPDSFLDRLASAARNRPLPSPGDLPPGLATRVLAHLREGSRSAASSSWERLALRALPVALVVMLACLWADVPASAPAEDHELLAALMLETQLKPIPQP